MRALVALFLMLLAAVPAAGQSRDQNLQDCRSPDPDRKIVACTRVLADKQEGQNNRVTAYSNRAYAYVVKGDHDRAIADYDQAIRLNPRIADLYHNRGIAWYHKGDYDRAIADYDQAIRLDPKGVVAHMNRGAAWRAKGDFNRAMADYDQAIRLDPNDARIYMHRAHAWYEKGDFDRAAADYGQAIRLDPQSAVAYVNRGAVHYQNGDHDSAAADYGEAIRLNPRLAAAYNGRGAVLAAKGDHDRAIADLDQAIAIDPKYARAYYHRGAVWRTRGEHDRAFADFDQSIGLDPGDPAPFAGRGLIHLARGDAERARADFRAALAAPPKYVTGAEAHREARAQLALLEAAPLPAAAPAGRRVALVIANAAYTGVPRLANPPNDADAVAASLRRVGFTTVTQRADLGREALVEALRGFAREAANADWAVVYFAGHGVELGGVNYLVPVDARLETDRDVGFEAVPLDHVLAAVEGAKRMRLVFLDACRNNPFLPAMRRTANLARSVDRGLGRTEPEGGSLVFYAAKHGSVALDGAGANSPFAAALARHLPTPGLEVGRLIRRVRDEVLKVTDQRQEPFLYGSLPDEDFVFMAAAQ